MRIARAARRAVAGVVKVPALAASWVRARLWAVSAENRVRGQLFEAAYALFQTPVARYVGTATTPGGERVELDARVSQDGAALATVRQSGVQGDVLAVGGHVFVRGPAEFWRVRGEQPGEAAQHAQGWVEVAPTTFGVDFEGFLAPAALADEVDLAAWDADFRIGPRRSVAGVRTREVTLPGLVVHLTTARPYRIVRVARR